MMQRLLLAGLAAALLTAASKPLETRVAMPIVQTSLGKVEGATANGVEVFLGVRYGADTGGVNRFLPPAPPAPWSDVRPALSMGARCPQPSIDATSQGPGVIRLSNAPTSEDCLFLNVWTPRADGGKRPVMVWIHGGAFGFGSANDKYYEGSNLARKEDVVVVSMNHRLNALGYLDLGPELGSRYAQSANVGMLDLVQALTWVRDNISQFGGDPQKVTIFGQSGGGAKVAVLMTMPAAHGLFARAVIESGALEELPVPAKAQAMRERLLAALGRSPSDARSLLIMPADDLAAAAAKVGLTQWRPVQDGVVIPHQPLDPAALAVSRDVPLVVGTARNEATTLLVANPHWPATTGAQLEAGAAGLLGAEQAHGVLTVLREGAPGDPPSQLLAGVMTVEYFDKPAWALAQARSAVGAPTYVYRIDWRTPVLDGVLRSPHGVELPFIFDNVGLSPELVGTGADTHAMADLMRSAFASFARDGRPSTRPAWPAYSPRKRETFIFDQPPHVVADPDAKLRVAVTGG